MAVMQVPKLRTPVFVSAGGTPFAGEIFLSEYAASHAGPEEVLDVLNAPDEFVPVMGSDERIRVVSRRNILWVRCRAPANRVEEPIAIDVELTLIDGTQVRGTVRFAAPEGRSRLQDWLNDAPRFISLEADDRRDQILVRRDAIAVAVQA